MAYDSYFLHMVKQSTYTICVPARAGQDLQESGRTKVQYVRT